MKKLFFTYILLMMIPIIGLQAQNPEDFPKKQFSPEQYIKDMREYICKKACLSPMEAQAFFPIYFEMQNKQRQNNEERMRLAWSIKEDSPENEYERVLEKMIELEIKDKQLEKEYQKKFHKILSYKKIYKVRMAAYRFNMQAMRRFTPNRRNENRPNRDGFRQQKH